MLGPSLLSSTVGSLNVYVDSFFCAGLVEGSWTSIVLANRLIQLPFGVLVGGALVSFLPQATALASKGELIDLAELYKRQLFSLLSLLLPVLVFIFFFGEDLVRIVFQRGAFGRDSSALVSSVLLGLAASLVTGLPRELYTRVFYALGESRLPLYCSLVAVGLNALLDWLLAPVLGVLGIAISTSLVAFANSLLLGFLLGRRRLEFVGLGLGWGDYLRLLGFGLCACLGVWLGSWIGGVIFAGINFWGIDWVTLGRLGLASLFCLGFHLLFKLNIKQT